MQDLRKKIKDKKIASKLDLGRSWTQLGRALGRSGTLLGHSESNFLEALVEDCPQEASGIDLGSILEGFGEDFDRVWEGFGESLGKA